MLSRVRELYQIPQTAEVSIPISRLSHCNTCEWGRCGPTLLHKHSSLKTKAFLSRAPPLCETGHIAWLRRQTKTTHPLSVQLKFSLAAVSSHFTSLPESLTVIPHAPHLSPWAPTHVLVLMKPKEISRWHCFAEQESQRPRQPGPAV